MKDMNNQTRIVVCGSPHSGKTVFSTSLYKVLPQKYTSRIEACLDGEGVYSNNEEQDIVTVTRRKGEMTEEFVQEIKERIQTETASIVLVDVGGLRSKENEEIFSQCDLAIILDKSEESMKEWRKFCEEQNLEVIAEIKSEISDKENDVILESEPTIKANICNLERGQDKTDNKVILELRNEISSIALKKGLVQKGRELLTEDGVYNMRETAKWLKMMDGDNISWNTEGAKDIYYYSSGVAFLQDEIKLFESRANWVTGLVCEAAEKQGVENISLYDTRMNKYIDTKVLTRNNNLESEQINDIKKYDIIPEKISLYVKENTDRAIMQFELNPNISIQVEDMDQMVLPDINTDKELYISGRLPLWLFASISRTYENSEKSVLQPGNSFIKYASSKSKNLGLVEKEIKDINLYEFLKEVRDDINFYVGGEAR